MHKEIVEFQLSSYQQIFNKMGFKDQNLNSIFKDDTKLNFTKNKCY